MKEDFNYENAIVELEKIVSIVEDPNVSIDDMDKYLKRSHELITQCRDYLRGMREKIDEAKIL